MLAEFQAVDGDAKLKAQLLFVRDVRGVDEVRVAHRDGAQHVAAEQRAFAVGTGAHRLAFRGDFVVRHLRPLVAQLAVEAPRHEAVAVGVDEVAGHVFAQRHGRRARQAEGHGAGAPERNLRPADDGAHVQSVAGQEALRREHAEGVDVVVPFGAGATTAFALEAFDEVVAAAEQRVVLRRQRALPFPRLVQAANLIHRPAQPPTQPRHHRFQFVHEGVHVAAQRFWANHVRIGLRPALLEHLPDGRGEIVRMVRHQFAQFAELERRLAQPAFVEQIRFHAARQAAAQNGTDLIPLRFPALNLASVAMQRRNHRGMNVLGHHHLVAQVEGWRVYASGEQLRRFGEVGAIVGRRAAVGDVHRHAVAASGAASALPVVGRQRRHVAHQHGVQLADVDAEFQGGRANQAVHRVRRALEEVLQALALLVRHHRGVFLGAQHGVGAVQHLQVVVVLVFANPLDLAVAAEGEAAIVGQVAHGRAAAAPAAAHAAIGAQAQLVRMDLVHAAHLRQRIAAGTLEAHRRQQFAFHQVAEQALKERFDGRRRHCPLAGDLAHGGISAAVAQPLGDQVGALVGAAAQLGGVRGQKAGKVALLNLAVAFHPVLGEDSVLRVVQGTAPAQIVQHAGDPFAQAFRGDAKRVGVFLNPCG